MSMAHPSLTTLNTKKKKKKLSAKQEKAKQEHETWLKNQGIHPEQIKARKGNEGPKKLKNHLTKDTTSLPCGNGFAPGGAKKSVFDSEWNRTYEDDPAMAEREAEALKRAEERKADIMPLYNKGPAMVLTNPSLLKDGNGRGKR